MYIVSDGLQKNFETLFVDIYLFTYGELSKYFGQNVKLTIK